MSHYHVTFKVPSFIDTILASPILALRKVWYGYTFRKIKLIGGRYAIVDNADFPQVSKHIWWLKDNNGCCKAVRFTAGANCGKAIYMHREIFFWKEKNLDIKNQNANIKNEGVKGGPWIKAFQGLRYATESGKGGKSEKGAKREYVVDHINRDGLDNRRGNLRLATKSQNNMNRSGRRGTSSGLKGVSWYEKKKYWRAMIQVEGKCYSLGHFENEEDAGRAYDAAARKYHGEFAYLNFPPQNLQGLRGLLRRFISKIKNKKANLQSKN